MATTLDVPVGPKKEKAKRRSRRGNPSTAENIRFFVGKPCRNKEAPQLEREVASEAEGLVAAFKTDASLFLLSLCGILSGCAVGRPMATGNPVFVPAGDEDAAWERTVE